MAKVNLVSQAEYARRRGVSKAAVSKAVGEGRISLIEGKIDPVAADAQWARNSRVRAGSGQAAAPAPIDAEPELPLGDIEADGIVPVVAAGQATRAGNDEYATARAKREVSDAEMSALNLAERRGEVIQIKAVEIVWSQAFSSLREHLLQLRARLAPLLAAESDPFKCGQLLDAEHRAALELLAKASYTAPGGEG